MSHHARSCLAAVVLCAVACNVYTDDMLRGGSAADNLNGSAGAALPSSGTASLLASGGLRMVAGSGGVSLGSGGKEPQPASAGDTSTSAGGDTSTTSAGGDAGTSAGGDAGTSGAGGHAGGGGTAGTSGGGAGNAGSASVACSGAVEFGQCWYLGAVGQSCNTVCANHGGVDLNGVTAVGTASQGGSLAECATLLTALGGSEAPSVAFRTDGRGLGCHLYNQNPYWLTAPQADPADQSIFAKLVCSCRE